MNLRNAWTIAWKDFKGYFTSPIAYIVIGGFLAIMGYMFFFSVIQFNNQNMQYQQFNMGKSISLTEGVVRPVYGNMNVLFLYLVPFITMRLFAEERKNQTLQLLLTAPVRLAEVILGKFLSAALLVAVMLGLTSIYPIILFVTGNPDIGPVLTNVLGVFLLASCLISAGVLFSAMTENQIVAGALTFAAGLLLWLISWASYSAGPVWSDIFSHLSLVNHFTQFGQGIVDSADVVYYLSFIFAGLFLTHRVLDSYRWR